LALFLVNNDYQLQYNQRFPMTRLYGSAQMTLKQMQSNRAANRAPNSKVTLLAPSQAGASKDRKDLETVSGQRILPFQTYRR